MYCNLRKKWIRWELQLQSRAEVVIGMSQIFIQYSICVCEFEMPISTTARSVNLYFISFFFNIKSSPNAHDSQIYRSLSENSITTDFTIDSTEQKEKNEKSMFIFPPWYWMFIYIFVCLVASRSRPPLYSYILLVAYMYNTPTKI